MSQDVKESNKSAHLHAVSKPARTSTIRGADPNPKSLVLDPGTAAVPLDPQGVPIGATHGDTEVEAQKDRDYAARHAPTPKERPVTAFLSNCDLLGTPKDRPVTLFLSQAQYDAVKGYADAEKVSVEELFLHFAEDLVAAQKLQALGNSPTDEPPAP
jgi:hypothetical protein